MLAKKIACVLLSLLLSFSVVFPVDAQNGLEREVTSHFSSFSFVLFYRPSCPHCQRFLPVLSEYAKTHQINVLSVNVDSPEFPLWKSIFLSDHQKVVPKLFLLNREQQTIFEVSIGDLSDRELSLRMNTLMEKIDEYERNHV